ncbi:MAG: nucleotidyltransferase family protein [Euryarchaeota archaeon]|nr:nucleotidyltransferase family protein [Euryarchaeota archaeon]
MARRPNDIGELRKSLGTLLRPHGALRISIFGSTARGEATPKSDLDLLVRFREPKSLLELVRLERELSKSLGRRVEIVTEEALNPHLRPIVEKQKVVVYEATVG